MGKLTFGATGLSYQVDRPAMNVGGAPMCPRCTKRVYFNEEKKHLGKSYHKACFNCASCRKHLDSTNVNGHEEEVYCTPCHRRLFGIKGYGYAGGAAGLSTDMSTRDMYRPRSSRLSSSGSVKTTTITQNARKPTTATEPTRTNGHTTREESASLNQLGSRPNSKVFKAPLVDKEDPDCCPRCGKRVYMAEEVKAIKRKWHRLCFKCANCKKTLESGRCEAHRGEVYCNSCYSKSFGPKGYGYASSMMAADPNPHFHVRKAVTARANSVSSSNASSPGIAPGRMSPTLVVSPGIAARMSPAPAMSPMQMSPAPGSPAGPMSPAAQPVPHRDYRVQMSPSKVVPDDKLYMTPNNDYSDGLTHNAPHPYEDVREQPRQAVSDTFTYNGEEWTDEKIMNELNQFQQVMM